jgi:hypothetical protein
VIAKRKGVRKFLGFRVTLHREPQRGIAPKAIQRFREKVRELTRPTRGVSVQQRPNHSAAISQDGKATSVTAKPLRCSETLITGHGDAYGRVRWCARETRATAYLCRFLEE